MSRETEMPSCSKLLHIYGSLPPESKEALVRKHLIPLLDILPKNKTKKILDVASRSQDRTKAAPLLDLPSKRRELTRLLDELERDAKRAFMKERSKVEEILYEIVDSLTNWIGNIWTTAFEYRIHFSLVHECLVFIMATMDRIAKTRGCCRCSYLTLYVPLTIKDKDGKMVKSFHLAGAQNLDRPLLWIWRELFLTMLACGYSSQVPSMLRDIEGVLGWQSLDRMLMGGRTSSSDLGEEDYDYIDDDYDDDDDDGEVDSDDDDSAYEDEDEFNCPFHSWHWPRKIQAQMLPLRRMVNARLTDIFRTAPTLALYNTLISTSIDVKATESELVRHLSAIATSCSESFAAALEIHAFRNCRSTLVSLLDSHSYLLRPRDAPALQTATHTVSQNPLYHGKAMKVLEKELLDTARLIKAAILPCFARIDDPVNRGEVLSFTKLPQGSRTRTDRLLQWIETVATPAQPPHPVAFAAFMMGLPIGPEEADSEDPLGIMNMDEDHDLEDLREELRPKYKQRFESWRDTAIVMPGANAVLTKVYREIIVMMPFLQGNDVVEEMISRLADRPSKVHVCDALDALLAFVKVQRRELRKRYRHAETIVKPSGRGFGPRGSVSAEKHNWTVQRPVFGGMEDVD